MCIRDSPGTVQYGAAARIDPNGMLLITTKEGTEGFDLVAIVDGTRCRSRAATCFDTRFHEAGYFYYGAAFPAAPSRCTEQPERPM